MNVAYSEEFVDTNGRSVIGGKRHRGEQSTDSFAERD